MEKNPLKRVLNRFLGAKNKSVSGDLRVVSVKEVADDRPLCVDVGGRELAVFRQEGKYYALANACTHLGGPLCKGRVVDGTVICPWHGAKFRIANGEVVGGPARKNAVTYQLELRGDDLFLISGK